MRRKLYFNYYDNADTNLVIPDLQTVFDLIKDDMESIEEGDNAYEYTVIPVWMTEKEFSELPESDYP